MVQGVDRGSGCRARIEVDPFFGDAGGRRARIKADFKIGTGIRCRARMKADPKTGPQKKYKKRGRIAPRCLLYHSTSIPLVKGTIFGSILNDSVILTNQDPAFWNTLSLPNPFMERIAFRRDLVVFD